MSMDKDFSITPAEGADGSEQADAASQLADLPAGAPILVSACLLGHPCRYDGRAKAYPGVQALARRYILYPICPEVAGGLLTPRPPAERQGETVRTADGQDLTAAYRQGAACAVAMAAAHHIRLAILKAKSPSCGSGQIYDGSFSRSLIPGQGVAAEALQAAGVLVLSEQDLPMAGSDPSDKD